MEPWPHTHVELVSDARRLLLRRGGPWIFEGEESFPTLGGLQSRIQIGDFDEVGRSLVIDGTVQLTEVIDPVYTTALVFPAALLAPSRRRWLIVGGGDGAAAREVLRFRDTESVRLVDVSRVVVEQTQALIPSFWAGCQHDPRLELLHRNATEVIGEMVASGDLVDVLVYDLSDPSTDDVTPFSESPADALYSEDAFRAAARCVRPGGVFVAQMAELSLLRWKAHARSRHLLSRIFRHVCSYRTHIEPFGYSESWILASDHEGCADPTRGIDVDGRLAELYAGDAAALYDAGWHQQLFTLPPWLRRSLSESP
jgi:spermidine synthase